MSSKEKKSKDTKEKKEEVNEGKSPRTEKDKSLNKEKVSAFRESSLRHQIQSIKLREEQLIRENEALRAEREQNSRETHEFVEYYQREMKKKDMETADLNAHLEKLQSEVKESIEKLKWSYETKILAVEETENATLLDITSKLEEMEMEMRTISDFKTLKEDLHVELGELKSELADLKVEQEEDMVSR